MKRYKENQIDEIGKSCPNLDGMLEGNIYIGETSTIVDLMKKILLFKEMVRLS